MKAVKAIKKFLIILVIVVFFAFAIGMTILMLNINKYGVTQFDNLTIIPIKNKVTSKNYQKGDLVILEKREVNEIKVGDELFVYKVKKDGGVDIDFGSVGEVHRQDGAISFENGGTYDVEKFVIGGSTKVYEGLGKYYSVVQSKWGFLFIVLVPSFLIFVYEIFALVIEIKYGKEETV